ncbi:dihydroneopterin aldolase [Alicyclobacillus fastidiosus]|uniref:dihydroneopterin aldolase n=1 Tax=Alicyclobacillus fastidiosus TaxID=392011 RepID=UPI0023E9E9FD|nr:dihydroneopterin aldolase [Alicyclobacillus fastidiosus]GMA62360.1 dihydroneopterin aldolase [Alicyclobacillus fastidiosus]
MFGLRGEIERIVIGVVRVDEIVLKGMPFYGYHGVLPEENAMGQRFVVNAWLACELSEAGHTDDVSKTVDYARVYAIVREVVEGPPKKLIEAVAEDIARALLTAFARLQSVTVEVEKPGAPIPGIFEQVSVKIRRDRA